MQHEAPHFVRTVTHTITAVSSGNVLRAVSAVQHDKSRVEKEFTG